MLDPVRRFAVSGFLLLVCACSNDTFNPNDDAGADASDAAPDVAVDAAPPLESGVLDGDLGDGSTSSFCTKQTTSVFFCDDFETEADPWTSWDSSNPSESTSAFTFGAGIAGRGASITNGLLSSATLTEQAHGNTLHSFGIALRIPSKVGLMTLLHVTTSTDELTVKTTTLGDKIVATGTTGSTLNVYTWDASSHLLGVAFISGDAQLSVDGTTIGSVPFSAIPTNFTFEVGVTAATAGTLVIDNVLLQ